MDLYFKAEKGGLDFSYATSQRQTLFNTDGIVGTALLADTLYARKIQVFAEYSFSNVFARVSSAAVGNGIIGLYNLDANGLPNKLLATSVALNTNVTSVQILALDFPQTLKLGNYALVYNASVNHSLNCSPAASVNPNWGYNGAILASGNLSVYTAAHVYTGSLPATFPAGTFATLNAPFILTY